MSDRNRPYRIAPRRRAKNRCQPSRARAQLLARPRPTQVSRGNFGSYSLTIARHG